jgi:hypothetical protein
MSEWTELLTATVEEREARACRLSPSSCCIAGADSSPLNCLSSLVEAEVQKPTSEV